MAALILFTRPSDSPYGNHYEIAVAKSPEGLRFNSCRERHDTNYTAEQKHLRKMQQRERTCFAKDIFGKELILNSGPFKERDDYTAQRIPKEKRVDAVHYEDENTLIVAQCGGLLMYKTIGAEELFKHIKDSEPKTSSSTVLKMTKMVLDKTPFCLKSLRHKWSSKPESQYCTTVQCWQKTPCSNHPKVVDDTAIRHLSSAIMMKPAVDPVD